ncbi:hypothetical protein BOX15_Mlig026854g1 [Macrostomum lignano]|uniref:RING-type E3 ubiquitin transferase n=2 Tax=Macrostomum lignano TaxID=282301 RepID=A0A267GP99_9PLAT|nr:hypothetical protein BOX15_Mlig026854g1 [Macrostomum lignano]
MAEGVSISAPNLIYGGPSTSENSSSNNTESNRNSNNNNINHTDGNSSSASLFESRSDTSETSSVVLEDGNQNPTVGLATEQAQQDDNETEQQEVNVVIDINDENANTTTNNNNNDDDADNYENEPQNDALAGEIIDLTDDVPGQIHLPQPIMIEDLDNDDNELDDFLVIDDLRRSTSNSRRRVTAPPDARTSSRRRQQQRLDSHPESGASNSRVIVKKRRLSDGEGPSGGGAAAASSSPPQPADEGCTICFEPWTSSGEHRVCALRCGHLFGKSCVERWLETRQQCPQCNRNCRRHEVLPLYVTNLRAVDNSENEALKLEIDKIKRAKLTAEQEAGDMRLRLDMLRDENRRLSRQLEFYRSHSSKLTIDLTDAGGETCSYHLEDNVMISQVGECRVLALNQQLNVLCISQPSRNPLFRGYGLRKLDLIDFRNSSYIHLHTNKLRDACFNPEGTLLLTASMDKQIRLTGFHSEQTVCYFDCPTAVWSCCWSPYDPNQFYAGLANGRVMCFDMRHIGSHVSVLPCAEEPPSVTSVVSMASLPAGAPAAGGAAPSALLAGQFDRLSLYRRPSTVAAAAATEADSHQAALLPMPGPGSGQQLAWLAADPDSRHVLLTHRPTANHQQQQPQQQRPGVEHSVYSLDFIRTSADSSDSTATMESALRPLSRIRAGQSMKLLARSRLFQQASRSGGALTVAAGDEATCRLNLWDAATGEKLQSMARLPSPVLDIAPVRHGRFLACLTEQSVYVYKDTKAE